MAGVYQERWSLNVVASMLCILAVTSTSMFIGCVQGQEDPGPVDPQKYDPNRQTGDENQYNPDDARNRPRNTDTRLQYFMDSPTDCDRPVRMVTEGPIIVYGRSATQQGSPVIDCTLQLELQTPQTASRLKVELTTMRINDCDVKFTIFDGAANQQKILNSYNCESTVSSTERIVYTSLQSNRITFVLDRRSQENLDYDIMIEVTVARSDPVYPDSGPDTDFGTWKFEQRYLVLIVGVSYAIVTAIMVIVFFVSCVSMPRKTPGQAWSKAQFSNTAYSNQALNTSAGSHPSNRGQPLTLGGWVKNGGMNAGMKIKPPHERNPIHVKKRIVRSEDADSVFESDADIVKKKPPPYTDTDGEQRRQIRTHNANKPRATERGIDTSYTLADDAHPQDYYLQREIQVPAKHKKSKRRNQKRDADMSSNSSSENEKLSSDTDTDAETDKTSLGMNNEQDVTEHGIQHDDDTDDEVDDSGDDGDDGDDDNDNEVANHMYAAPHKPVKQERQDNVQRPVPAPRTQTPDEPARSRNHTPEPHPRPGNTTYQDRYPPVDNYPKYYPPTQQYYEPQQPRYAQGYPQNDASYDPIPPPSYNVSRGMAPQNQPANYGMAPPHQPATYAADQQHRHPPPYATSTPPRHRRGPPPPQGNSYPQQANPKDPPVYSYLVQRGYNPQDTDGYSPASSATSHQSTDNRLGLDESGYSANLDSGVELMKRHTAV